MSMERGASAPRSSSSPDADTFTRFRELLRTGNPLPSDDARQACVENAGGAEADLSDVGIGERVKIARYQLHMVVKNHLGGRQDLLDLADRIVADGEEALKLFSTGDPGAAKRQDGFLAKLETIVRLDGSRPTFMVRNGDVDLTTSPVGGWLDAIETSRSMLKQALACVGRIDVPSSRQGFEGTGFLIGRDAILTNRHVLQSVAARNGEDWTFGPGAAIDFGHEFRSTKPHPRRALSHVVFCGEDEIDLEAPVDHRHLDLALIALEPVPDKDAPEATLSVDVSPDWAEADQQVYVVGYPGRPLLGTFKPTLLEQLFQTTFGCKRLAPGTSTRVLAEAPSSTMAHDATTLGGNSGSLVAVVGREMLAAGLHYGGEPRAPRENWGHVLGTVLDAKGSQPDGRTLRDCLEQVGADLIDRQVSGTSPRTQIS